MMKNMLKLIRKKIYQHFLNKKLENLDARKLFKIMDEYDKLYGRPVDVNIKSDELVGFNIGDNYDIFYKNVHIHYSETQDHIITRVSIKRDDDSWVIGDTFSEGNESMEVYLTYNIAVLGGLRCTNTILKNGAWNEYVFKTLEEIESIVLNYTRESKFNKEYDKMLDREHESRKKESD